MVSRVTDAPPSPSAGLIEKKINGQRTGGASDAGQRQRLELIGGLGIHVGGVRLECGAEINSQFGKSLGQALHDAQPAVRHELGDLVGQSNCDSLIDVVKGHEARASERPVVYAGYRMQDGDNVPVKLKDRNRPGSIRCRYQDAAVRPSGQLGAARIGHPSRRLRAWPMRALR